MIAVAPRVDIGEFAVPVSNAHNSVPAFAMGQAIRR
jgi:hypothetical protein